MSGFVEETEFGPWIPDAAHVYCPKNGDQQASDHIYLLNINYFRCFFVEFLNIKKLNKYLKH